MDMRSGNGYKRLGYQEHWNTELRNKEHQSNTGTLAEHWNTRRNNGTLAQQSEYHGVVEHEKSSRITEQQDNTKKYYQYRTTAY